MKTQKRIYGKDIQRTIRNNLRRFLAIAVITILGAAMFSGLEAACEDLRRSADRFFDSQKLFDLQVMSTLGLTEEDVEALAAVDGVEEAVGIWQENADVRVGESTVSVTLRALSDSFNRPYLLEGRMPEKPDEAVVTQKFLDENGAYVGDVFTVRVSEEEDESKEKDSTEADTDLDVDFDEAESALLCTEFHIVGAVTDALEVNNAESGAVSYRSAATNRDAVYVLPEAFDTDLYAVIYLRAAGTMDELCYDDAYTARIAEIKAFIEDEIMEDREAARYAEVTGDALEKIEEAEADVEKELDDARKELEEGEQTLKEELEEAKKELDDGEKELEDGRQQLEEGEATLNQQSQSAEAQLAAGQQELAAQRKKLEEGDAELKQKEAEAAPQMKEAEEKIAAGRTELEAQEKAAQEQIDSGRTQITDGLAQIESGRTQITDGLAQIESGRTQITDGLAQIAAVSGRGAARGARQAMMGTGQTNDKRGCLKMVRRIHFETAPQMPFYRRSGRLNDIATPIVSVQYCPGIPLFPL